MVNIRKKIIIIYKVFLLHIKIQVHIWKPKEDKLEIKTLEIAFEVQVIPVDIFICISLIDMLQN